MANSLQRSSIRACPVTDLPEEGTYELSLKKSGQPLNIILLCHAGKFNAYLNRCPHLGLPLNWLPNQFMDRSGKYLICANHGALFRPQDGVCIFGPCCGQQLKPLTVQIADGWIELSIVDEAR